MALDLSNITFACEDPQRVAAFWQAALGRTLDDGASEFFASLSGPVGAPKLLFLKVPEHKTVKNRVHLDLHADDREAEVARLLALGATHVDDHDEYGMRWTTLRDVEGNELCIG
ncbi:MAG: VOC family protein [Acidimicrobiales bacterium]